MSVPRYPKYKDSGLDWLGEVPEHWEVHGLKSRFQIVGGSTPKTDSAEFWDGNINWATPADLSNLKSRYLSETKRTLTDSGLSSCAATLVRRGSVILSTRAPIGSLAIAGGEMCTNQGCKALVPFAGSSPSFYGYFLGNCTEQLNLCGKGTTFLELSSDVLGAFKCPVPPHEEQQQIAGFLDFETARIDRLIAEQQRLIELLKEKRQAVISHAVTKGLNPDVAMKPSGVEWLGDVPEHWTVVPVAARYEVQLGKMLDTARVLGNNLRPYVRVADVQWSSINTDDLPLMDFSEDDREKFALAAGDILVNEGGSYVGRSAIWRGDLEECYYQKALHRLRPRSADSDEAPFMLYLMFFATTLGVFVAGNNQNTIDHLPAEKLKAYRFAFPPRVEQIKIAQFIDNFVSKSECLVKDAERAITLLQERRTALISAAVTGKIDVRSLTLRAEPLAAAAF